MYKNYYPTFHLFFKFTFIDFVFMLYKTLNNPQSCTDINHLNEIQNKIIPFKVIILFSNYPKMYNTYSKVNEWCFKTLHFERMFD